MKWQREPVAFATPMAQIPVSISNGDLFQCTLGQMWTFITHKGVWIQCDSNLGCNNDKNQRHHILSYISPNFSKSTRRNFQDVQKLHHQHGCCGRPIPVEPYAFFESFPITDFDKRKICSPKVDWSTGTQLGLSDNFSVSCVWAIQSDVG